MNEFIDIELPIDMKNYEYDDELYHIKDIHCRNCHERQDFYLKQGVARCECCHHIVTPTKKDIKSVAKRSPRAGGLRFKGIFHSETRARHFQYMSSHGFQLTHSN